MKGSKVRFSPTSRGTTPWKTTPCRLSTGEEDRNVLAKDRPRKEQNWGRTGVSDMLTEAPFQCLYLHGVHLSLKPKQLGQKSAEVPRVRYREASSDSFAGADSASYRGSEPQGKDRTADEIDNERALVRKNRLRFDGQRGDGGELSGSGSPRRKEEWRQPYYRGLPRYKRGKGVPCCLEIRQQEVML